MRWWVVVVLSLGCSSSSNEPQLGATDAGKKDVAVTPEAEAPFVCDQCSTEISGEPVPADWQCIKTMDAQVVELDGKPIEGVVLMACSPARCVHNDSDVNGKVHLEQCAWLPQPSFRVVGFERFVQFAIPMRGPATDFSFLNVPLVHLPDKGVTITPGAAQVLSQNGATLTLAAGEKNITLDPFGPYSDFRAVELPLDHLPKGLDPGLGFGVIYELGPQNGELVPPAKLTLPNRAAWPKGTEVEVFLQNYDTVKALPAKIGEWYRVSGGTVTDDGVVTDAGIPRLSLVGVRKKP